MTTGNLAPAWTDYAQRLAAQLRASGDVRDPAWEAAIAQTPRHLLVPSVYAQRSGLTTSDTPTDVEGADGMARVYSPTTLVTAIEHNEFGAVVPVSSSTKPDLMVRMLEELDVHDGQKVLEIGTGTGYNAALLAHRLGSENVFSVDIDPNLIDDARTRLAGIGHHPHLAADDGIDGWPEHAPYDRIIATCGVRRIPPAWFTQLVPGGKVLVDFKPRGGNLVLLQREQDRLEGRFSDRYGAFMVMRHGTGRIDDPARAQWRPALPISRERGTSTPTDLPAVVWLVHSLVSGTGLRRGYQMDEQKQEPTAVTFTTADGSRCAVDLQADDAGVRRVVEGGPTNVWGQIELAYQQWRAWDEPRWSRFGVTVSFDDTDQAQQHAIWLDQPDNVIGIV